jgi:hypothetical protein
VCRNSGDTGCRKGSDETKPVDGEAKALLGGGVLRKEKDTDA